MSIYKVDQRDNEVYTVEDSHFDGGMWNLQKFLQHGMKYKIFSSFKMYFPKKIQHLLGWLDNLCNKYIYILLLTLCLQSAINHICHIRHPDNGLRRILALKVQYLTLDLLKCE